MIISRLFIGKASCFTLSLRAVGTATVHKSSHHIMTANAMPSELNSKIGDSLVTRVTDNVDVPIRSLYANHPAVLIFFRRFGCPLCRSYGQQLSKELHPILKANNVGFVGIGLERLGLEEFQEGKFFSGDLYVDEGKKAYRLLDLSYLGWIRGIMGIFSPSARAWNEETKRMGVGGNMKGDGFQLGATYVVGPKDGQVWLAHPQKDYGDHPSIDDIIKSLREHIPEFRQ